MIPCPIADGESVWEVLPKANLEIINSLDYFVVENIRSARRFLSKAGIERKIDELEFVELNEHTVAVLDARATYHRAICTVEHQWCLVGRCAAERARAALALRAFT